MNTQHLSMVTIAQLLKHAVFAEAQVVAGEAGLTKVVEWSHIIDIPKVKGMVEPKTLVITTGQGISLQSEAQTEFVNELIQAEVSGLILSVGGTYFHHVPDPILKVANQQTLPIIIVPHTIRFIDITHTIHEQLISRQYALLKQSDYIHQTLTQLVLEGGGLQEVAETLARLVNRSVTIENPELSQLLAYAIHGEVDQARQASIEAGKTPDLIRKWVLDSGILESAKQRLQPVFVPASPDYGMTKERILAPIVVGREIYGYVWLIAGDEPMDELDRLTIERAAMVAALIMLNETAVRQISARLQADLISQLLSGQAETLILQDRANRLGLDLQQPQRVLLVKPPSDSLPSLRLADNLSRAIQPIAPDHILQPFGLYFILIVPDNVDAKALSQSLIAVSPALKVAIGRSAPALVNLAQSYREAEEAMEIGKALVSEYQVYDFDDLGFLPWLYHLPAEIHAVNPYIQRIEQLATNEKAARANLLGTLEALLDCGSNVSETARILGIHRNTLTYRLKQVETLCQVSLSKPEVRLNLQIAIKAYRLQENKL